MRKATLILAVILGLIGLTGQAQAAGTDTITVTVELETVVSVAITPVETWAIGPIGLGLTDESPTYTATNDGNVSIDLDIRGANGNGGWTIGATAGTDTFVVAVDGLGTLTASDQALDTNVAPAGTKTIDMTYTAPTGDAQGAGVDQGFTITVTASAS